MKHNVFRLNIHINIRAAQKAEGSDLREYNTALARIMRKGQAHDKLVPPFDGSFDEFKKLNNIQ